MKAKVKTKVIETARSDAGNAGADAILKRTLTEGVDYLYAVRTERLAAQHAVDLLEEREKTIRANIEKLLRDAKLDGYAGEHARAYFQRLQVPQLTDDEAFLKWASQKKNRDVLKVGINNEAWRARLADGVKVPGTEAFLKETLAVKGVK